MVEDAVKFGKITIAQFTEITENLTRHDGGLFFVREKR